MMFWDQVAGVYDIFVNVINRKTHKIDSERDRVGSDRT